MAANSVTLRPLPTGTDELNARRRAAIVGAGVLVGLAAAMLWSAQLVDDEIGERVAAGMLGHDARSTVLDSGVTGAVFAFVAGLAGTFTACNVAAFSAMGPMLGRGGTAGMRVRTALKQVGWLAVGLLAVALVYGAVGAAVGTRIPQLSNELVGHHMPLRLVQSIVVFCVIGVAYLWLGLAAVDVVPDPTRRLAARRPQAPTVIMGALIGGFLIGRPYPLFYKLFQDAAASHNPLYGAATFALTALGNVVVVAVAFLLLAALAGRYGGRLAARPGLITAVSGAALIAGGVFMILYWGVRLPARFDYGWFPTMPWH